MRKIPAYSLARFNARQYTNWGIFFAEKKRGKYFFAEKKKGQGLIWLIKRGGLKIPHSHPIYTNKFYLLPNAWTDALAATPEIILRLTNRLTIQMCVFIKL